MPLLSALFDNNATDENDQPQHAVVQARYGPCLGCRYSMDLVIEMKKTSRCCWVPPSFSSSAKPFLSCAQCGFQTDAESYNTFQEITSDYISSPSESEDEGDDDDDDDSVAAPSCSTSSSSCCGLSTIDEEESFLSTTASVTDSHSSASSSLSSKTMSSRFENRALPRQQQMPPSPCLEMEDESVEDDEASPVSLLTVLDAAHHSDNEDDDQDSVQEAEEGRGTCLRCKSSWIHHHMAHEWRFCPSCGSSSILVVGVKRSNNGRLC